MQDMPDDPDLRRTYGFLRRCAMRMCGDPATAQDLVQDTLLVAHANASQFRGHAAYSTWLYGILRNVHRAYRRSTGRMERRHRALAAYRETLSETGQYDEMAEIEHVLVDRELAEYLASLDAERRSAFIMMELEGRTGHETAAALGVHAHTVYGWVRATRRELSHRIDRRDHAAQRRSGAMLLPCFGGLELRSPRSPLRVTRVLLAVTATVACVLGVGRSIVNRRAPPASGVAQLDADASVPSVYPRVAPLLAVAEPTAEVRPARATSAARVQRRATARRRAPAAPSDRVSLDYRRFDQARRMYADGQVERALDLLAQIDSHGQLGWHRAATEIGALCYLGRRTDAEDVATRWSAEHPDRRLEVPPACDHELRAVVADARLPRRDDGV